MLRLALGGAIGICVVTAAVRAQALEAFGIGTPDNRIVVTDVAHLVERPAPTRTTPTSTAPTSTAPTSTAPTSTAPTKTAPKTDATAAGG
jgi:hypothetical protein